MCLSVWQHISQPPILQLNAEHPLGDGFGSLQNGKSIFAEGVIGGLGGKKSFLQRGKVVHVWLLGEQTFAYFSAVALFVLRIGKTWMGRYLQVVSCAARVLRGVFANECLLAGRFGRKVKRGCLLLFLNTKLCCISMSYTSAVLCNVSFISFSFFYPLLSTNGASRER